MTGYTVTISLPEGSTKPVMTVDQATKTPTLEQMQAVVGGLIEPMFTVASPVKKDGGTITGYVNEEFTYIFGEDHPATAYVGYRSSGYMVPWKGNMFIVGVTKNGNTRLLTGDEVAYITKAWAWHTTLVHPVLLVDCRDQ
jgi:hypothetical protein